MSKNPFDDIFGESPRQPKKHVHGREIPEKTAIALRALLTTLASKARVKSRIIQELTQAAGRYAQRHNRGTPVSEFFRMTNEHFMGIILEEGPMWQLVHNPSSIMESEVDDIIGNAYMVAALVGEDAHEFFSKEIKSILGSLISQEPGYNTGRPMHSVVHGAMDSEDHGAICTALPQPIAENLSRYCRSHPEVHFSMGPAFLGLCIVKLEGDLNAITEILNGAMGDGNPGGMGPEDDEGFDDGQDGNRPWSIG